VPRLFVIGCSRALANVIQRSFGSNARNPAFAAAVAGGLL
jgi:hypothetical protein